jgi:hypothetical protein
MKIDKYLASFESVKTLVKFLETKMILGVTVREQKMFTTLGIEMPILTFKVTTLHMGEGEKTNYFYVDELVKHNADVLIENVMEVYA